MSEHDEQDYEYDERWPKWMREWVLPFIQEELLYPVGMAIAAHFSVVYALMLVSVQRDGWDGPWTWLACSVVTSAAPVIWELSLFKRPAVIALVVSLTWLLAFAIAWYGVRAGYI